MKLFAVLVPTLSVCVCLAAPPEKSAGSQPPSIKELERPGNWLTVGGDTGHTKYSPLKQITTENVTGLVKSWSYPSGGGEVTPVVIDGVLFYPSGHMIIALNGQTGEQIWKTDMSSLIPIPAGSELNPARGAGLRSGPGGGGRGPGGPGAAAPAAAGGQGTPGPGSSTPAAPAGNFLPLGNSSKYGVAYWPGTAKTGPRIVISTSGGYLLQLDAKTGTVCKEFGDNGAIDLRRNVMEGMPYTDYTPGMLPTIYKNLAIVAPRTGEQGRYGPPGDPRAFDLTTGKEVWRFHVVPRPGEANFGTWGLNGWQDRRGPGSWVPLSVDYSTGTIFLSTGNATDQDYGAARPGDNLYATSVVALDGDTGKLKWFYQTTHHDIYDWDLNSPPVLAEVKTADGRRVPAIVQNTKQGYLFVLDRATGKPLLPVEERSVPASDAPGEFTSPTQPVPVKPGPITRVSMSRDEVANLSPESHKFCLDIYDKVLQAGEGGPYSMVPTLVFPSSTGGGTYAGATYDPDLNYIFVNDKDLGTIAMLTSQLSNKKFESLAKSKIPFEDPNGYPCSAPPWGELMAIDAATGDFVWREPLGEINALTAKGIPKTGTDNAGGSIATGGGLLFIGASQDKTFRAIDAKTGKELWSADLGGNANSTPVTFLGKNGKQYVSIVVAGRVGAAAGQLVTFALP